MALTREAVESIGFEIAKQKYYNAHKVDECLGAFKAEVIALIEENEKLLAMCGELADKLKDAAAVEDADDVRAQADKYSADAKAQADEFLSKTNIYAKQIIDDAQKRAEEMIRQARTAAAALSPVKPDGSLGGALSMRQLDAIDSINKQLDELNVTQATQLMRIKQAIMLMATDM